MKKNEDKQRYKFICEMRYLKTRMENTTSYTHFKDLKKQYDYMIKELQYYDKAKGYE